MDLSKSVGAALPRLGGMAPAQWEACSPGRQTEVLPVEYPRDALEAAWGGEGAEGAMAATVKQYSMLSEYKTLMVLLAQSPGTPEHMHGTVHGQSMYE